MNPFSRLYVGILVHFNARDTPTDSRIAETAAEACKLDQDRAVTWRIYLPRPLDVWRGIYGKVGEDSLGDACIHVHAYVSAWRRFLVIHRSDKLIIEVALGRGVPS